MKIRTCFITFNYLLAALGISCLILSETFPGNVNMVLIAGLVLCFVLEMRKVIPFQSPPRLHLWKLSLLFVLIFYFLMDLPLLELLVGFLILILFVRLILKTELNDYLYGYMIAIVCLLIGAIYVRELVFGFLFLSFYLILCWALILYNLMVERAGSRCPPHKFKNVGEREMAGISLFGLSAGLVLVSLVLTGVIFVSFPRIGLGFISLGSDSSPISGFSEKVTLGDVGKIKQNHEVVMRVEFTRRGKPYRPRSVVLWRGVALDRFDGRAWSSTMAVDWRYDNRPGRKINLFAPGRSSELIRQKVYMEAFDSDIIFTYGLPVAIDGPFRALKMDQGFVLRTVDYRAGPRKYNMISDISRAQAGFATPEPFTHNEKLLKRFLQLPELSPEIIRQAKSLARPGDSFTQKADNILDYFRDGFEYSLEMVKQTNKSSLDEFLFQRKRGHCEYFASAMVILLRLNGVPARMVNGFMGMEWNEWGNYMIVREQNAHSWVEAFIPGQGWTVYDPTPPDPSMATLLNGPLSLFMDLMRLNWQRYVIRYSIKDQIKIVRFFSSRGRAVADRFKTLRSFEWRESIQYLKQHPVWILLAAGIIIVFSLWQRNGWWLGLSRKPPQALAVILYKKMLRRLEKRGVPKSGRWTPREFLNHLSPLAPEKRRLVETVTAFYEKCRFGNAPPRPKDREKIQALIHQL
ncbi:MAG: DUF3488 and DUF4129 domain-containing transglutaminase family protein [Nitrospinales bacterium]